MKLECDTAAMSIIGSKKRNEDSYYSAPDIGVFIVADGVSGAPDGDKASSFATDTMAKFLSRTNFSSMTLDQITFYLGLFLSKTNRAVYDKFFYKRVYDPTFFTVDPPSTTITTVVLTDDFIVHGNIGDSRLYVLSASDSLHRFWRRSYSTQITLEQVTEDNIYFAGHTETIPTVGVYKLKPTDCGFLLCTDGFYKHMHHIADLRLLLGAHIENGVISEFLGKLTWHKHGKIALLLNERSPKEVLTSLESECSRAYDNVTVIYGQFRNR